MKPQKITVTRGHACLFFHVWLNKSDVGSLQYSECFLCATRRVIGSGHISASTKRWLLGANTNAEPVKTTTADGV